MSKVYVILYGEDEYSYNYLYFTIKNKILAHLLVNTFNQYASANLYFKVTEQPDTDYSNANLWFKGGNETWYPV